MRKLIIILWIVVIITFDTEIEKILINTFTGTKNQGPSGHTLNTIYEEKNYG